MNFEISEQEQIKIMQSLEETLQKVYAGRAKEISFTDTHRNIYSLVRADNGKKFEEIIENTLKVIYSRKIRQVKEEEKLLQSFVNKLTPLLSNIDKMMKLCFSAESQYYQKKEKPISLRSIAHNLLKDEIMKVDFMPDIISEIVKLCMGIKRVQSNIMDRQLLKKILDTIFALDPEFEFIETFFFPKYLQELIIFNQYLSEELKQSDVKNFMQRFLQCYEQQKKFLEDFFNNKAKDLTLKQVLKAHYKGWIGSNKEYLLNRPDTVETLIATDKQLVFSVYKLDQTGFKQFSEWYVNLVKHKLDKLDTKNNDKLITDFTYLYNRTLSELTCLNENSLNSKTKIAFEVWLNQEHLNIVNRLNQFISEFLVKKIVEKENSNQDSNKKTISNIMVIFKFVKDKDMFEKGYRKMLISRLVNQHVNMNSQTQIVKFMGAQCGDCWPHKIEGVLKQYNQSLSLQSKNSNCHILIFSELNWPHDLGSQLKLCNELLQFKHSIETNYIKQNPTRVLRWNPYLGNGTLKIKFNKTTIKSVLMPTSMMNLVLTFNKKNTFSVDDYLKISGDRLDTVKQDVLALYKSGIIILNKQLCDTSSVSLQSVLILNVSFTSHCETVTVALLKEQNKLELVKRQQLSSDRKLMVQSIMIKIIKAQKNLSKQNLFSEVNVMIEKKGFSPNLELLSDSLKDLIERDYIKECSDGNYGYLA